MNTKLDLSGSWSFILDGEKKGLEEGYEVAEYSDTITLPGTTSLAGKGPSNRARETYFLTEVHRFEGYAWYQKKIELPFKNKTEMKGHHFFLTLERTRKTLVWVDGVKVTTEGKDGLLESFIGKHVYDLSAYIKSTKPVITVMVSNTDYVVGGGHMTSQDTQTNWNGIIGEISLEICDEIRITNASSFCDFKKKQARINIEIESFLKTEADKKITVTADLCKLKKKYLDLDSDCSVWEKRATNNQAEATDMTILEKYLDIKKDAVKAVGKKESLSKGTNLVELILKFPEDAKEWDEEDPYVYRLNIKCGEADKTIWFGLKEYKAGGDHFTINGRKTFLRGRHQGMLFPLSGFAPMNVTGWLKDLKIAKDWGINHERCHTCTPPEAAFLAADLLGIYLQPEIPFWGTWQAETDDNFKEVKAAQDFLTEEGYNILDEFAGHPSFVMMSMGNELWGSPEALNDLVGAYKQVRPDICFTQGSNNFQWVPNIQPNDDFFSGVRFSVERQIRGSYAQCDAPLGRVQKGKPSTNWNYDNAISPKMNMRESALSKDGTIEIQYGTGVKRVKLSEAKKELIPNIPVVSHEIGQYFMYPDFNEIRHYTGVLQARNLEIFQERLDDVSLYKRAGVYFSSSGALAMACYKEELEAALRSSLMAGFQILDLQDFSGQGGALVGPLNSLMENKGLISAKEWRSFCGKVTVLGEFDSYEVTNGKTVSVGVKLAYFTKKPVRGAKLIAVLTDRATDKKVYEEVIKITGITDTGLYDLTSLSIKIPGGKKAGSYELSLRFTTGNEETTVAENSYVFWNYPAKIEELNPQRTLVVGTIREAMEAVDEGRPILCYLNPSDVGRGVNGAYCTDFWNYPMFKSISESMGKTVPVGTLGTHIARSHPALSLFPSESFTTPQWFDIIERSKACELNGIGFRPIVTVIDNCERNDNMGMIFEFEVMDGANGPCHVLVCTSPLPTLIKEGNKPAALLQNSLINYLEGGEYICQLRTNTSALNRLSR